MVVVHVAITYSQAGELHVQVDQLAREDARPEEREIAQAIEQLIMDAGHYAAAHAGQEMTVNQIAPYADPAAGHGPA